MNNSVQEQESIFSAPRWGGRFPDSAYLFNPNRLYNRRPTAGYFQNKLINLLEKLRSLITKILNLL